jgi:EpsI family protein
MSGRRRLPAVAAALLLPALLLARWLTSAGSFADVAEAPRLPTEIGAWSLASERSLSREELDQLAPDAYLARRYDHAGMPIWVYVAVYAGQRRDGRGAHDPQVCYPAQGWEVVRTRRVEVPLADGESFPGNLFVAQQNRAEQIVLYWFQPAERWAGRQSVEQLSRIWDAVAGRPQFAFVRISTPVVEGRDAVGDLVAFAQQISWPVREALRPPPPAELHRDAAAPAPRAAGVGDRTPRT